MKRIRVLQRTTIYRGQIIRLIRERLELEGHRFIRETVLHPGAVVVIPLMDHSRMLFVRQYRRAIRRFLLELPAGTLAPGERLMECAKRELEEETGWRARHLRRVAQFYAAPGFISERLTVFLAWGLTKTLAHPEADEFVTPIILSLDDALKKVDAGAICDAKSIIGVLLTRRWLQMGRLPGRPQRRRQKRA